MVFEREADDVSEPNLEQKVNNSRMDLDEGEVSCFIVSDGDSDKVILTEDFEAYNTFFNRLGGQRVMCLCEIIMNTHEINQEAQALVKLLDRVFIDKTKLDSLPKEILDQAVMQYTQGLKLN